MRNPGSDVGFEGLRGPGETLRDFGFPKNHFLGFMHMFQGLNCRKMTNPGSDVGLERLRRPGETRRDFGLPKNHCLRLHAYVSMVKLPENDESVFRFWVGGTQETRRDPARFWAPTKPLLEASCICFPGEIA
jgi:hypothetical protein